MHHEQSQAARAVQRVMEGATLWAALASVDDTHAGRGRTLVQELVYGTLRHWGTLRAIADRLAARPLADAPVRALLAVTLYQLAHTRAPAFAVVDRAVEAVALVRDPPARGVGHAPLRRHLRRRGALHAGRGGGPGAPWAPSRRGGARVA